MTIEAKELQDMSDRLAAEDCPHEVTAEGLRLAVQALRHVLNGLPNSRVPGPVTRIPHEAVIAGCTAASTLLVQITDVLGRLEAQLITRYPEQLYDDPASTLRHHRAVNAANALQRALNEDVPAWAVRHLAELALAELRNDHEGLEESIDD